MADPNEPSLESWLKFARDLMSKDHRREAYAVLRYFGGTTGVYHTNSLAYITRWKSKEYLGNDWGRDKETRD